MSTEIDISVIIPVYNAEKYLARCFKSIINQTYDNYEVFLINDGSTDSSEQICKKYVEEDRRVKYIYQENGGVSSARNRGIKEAKGKYIVFLDNDDYVDSLFFEKIVTYDFLDADVMLFQFKNVFSDDEISLYIDSDKSDLKLDDIQIFDGKGEYLQRELFCPTNKDIKNSTIVFPWGKAYKSDFLKNNNLQFDSRIKLCEDVYLNLHVYEKAKRVIYVKQLAYLYFHNKQSAGKGFNPNVVEFETNNIRLLDEFVNSVQRSKQYLHAYNNCLCFRYWSCCFSYFIHPQNSKNVLDIIKEMKDFEKKTNIRRAFKSLPWIRKSMGRKEWIFLMFIKMHLYIPIVYLARKKMKYSRG